MTTPLVTAVHGPPDGLLLDSRTKVLAAKGQESKTFEPERAILNGGAAPERGTPSRMAWLERSTMNRRPCSSIARPHGLKKCALVPSPLFVPCARATPPMVVTTQLVPTGVIFRRVLLNWSLT